MHVLGQDLRRASEELEMKTVKLKLTTLVYNCPVCDYDETVLVLPGDRIRRVIEGVCHNTACPSHAENPEANEE